MRTVVEIAIVTVLAWLIAEYQPWGQASLGNFYATMVLVASFYAIRASRHDFIYSAIFFFMACGYIVDEATDWQYPAVVMTVDIALGVIIFQWCKSADKANEYLGGLFLCGALWTAAFLYSGRFGFSIPISIYAMVLNFLAIVSWVLFANLSINRRRVLIPEGDSSLYLRVLWNQIRK